MKICSISDTHGIHPSFLQPCDILTVSGDIAPALRMFNSAEMQERYFFNEFIPVFGDKAKHVVFVGGNHDKLFEKIFKAKGEDEFRKRLPSNFHYLRDSEVVIDGIRFYGSPWTPPFLNWYFMSSDVPEGLGERFVTIPEGVDFLLTHGPAYGYGDKVTVAAWSTSDPDMNLGSRELLKAVKRAKPQFLVSGHIHTGDHKELKIYHDEDMTSYTTARNVSVLDESYDPTYTDVFAIDIAVKEL